MLKKLMLAATATAIVALAVQPAFAATASKTFDVNATVNTIATIAFSVTSYNFTSDDNTTQFLASSSNNGVATYSLRGTYGVAPSIVFTAPATVSGTHSNSIPIGTFSYECSVGSSAPVDGAGGAVAATYTNSGSQGAIASGSNGCAAFPTGASVAPGAQVNLGLFLDDRSIAADTYSTSGGAFTITVTAN